MNDRLFIKDCVIHIYEEGGVVADEKHKNLVPVSRKAGKGKGAYGGANITRKPKPKSTASTVARPMFAVGLLALTSLILTFI